MQHDKLEELIVQCFGSEKLPIEKEKLILFAEEYHKLKTKELYTFRPYQIVVDSGCIEGC